MNELKLDEIIHMIKQLSDEKQEELLKETDEVIKLKSEIKREYDRKEEREDLPKCLI